MHSKNMLHTRGLEDIQGTAFECFYQGHLKQMLLCIMDNILKITMKQLIASALCDVNETTSRILEYKIIPAGNMILTKDFLYFIKLYYQSYF